MQLIPSLDLRGGRVVRLRHGDPDRMTTYDLEPEAWLEGLVRAGAQRIHLVDLDGAFGEPRQPLFRRIPRRWPEVRFQLGGGLRTRGAVEDALAEGFDAVVGTLAVERPAELAALPPGRVVLALDLKVGRLCVRGWQSLADCADAEVFEALRSLGFDQALVDEDGMARLLMHLFQFAKDVAGGVPQLSQGLAGFVRLGFRHRPVGRITLNGIASDGVTSVAESGESVWMDYSGLYMTMGTGFDFGH